MKTLLKPLFLWLIASCFLSLAVVAQERKSVSPEKLLKTVNSIPNKYIVVFDDAAVANLDESQLVADLSRQVSEAASEATVEHVYSNALKGFSAEMSFKDAQVISQDPRVKYVIEDGVATLSATQYNPPSWGLDRIDQQFRPLNGTYNYTLNGAGVRAYVIDSGILPSHAEFGGRAAAVADFIGDGRNGIDCHGHGTHVAGTIAGANVGVAKAARVLALRVFGCTNSGDLADVVAAVDWVRANGVRPAVVNMSLGGGANQAVDDAVRNLVASGFTVVVAAGNSGADANGFSPARTREAITVGSTDLNDGRSSYSNYGTAVDLFAPGRDINSAWFNGGYNTISGTSMASPHVAGAAALYLQLDPGAVPATVQNIIVSAATRGVVGNPGPGSPNALLFSGIYNSCGALYAGQGLFRGQWMRSCNGTTILSFQTDGNVVLYKNTGQGFQALWWTGTVGRADASYFVMQTDGNLVLYNNANIPLWNAGTVGNPNARLAVQDDRNLVIYRADGPPIWWTGTNGM